MAVKYFPLDCTPDCPHYMTWDLSIDDWVSYCDQLNVQVDDCDGEFIRYRCPLEGMEKKDWQSENRVAGTNRIPLRW